MKEKYAALSGDALEMVAARFRVLGEPMRLKLLQGLMRGEKNVTELVTVTDATQANVSKHLSVLLQSGLIYRRKEGLNVYYGIMDDGVSKLCSIVCGSLQKQLIAKTRAIADLVVK